MSKKNRNRAPTVKQPIAPPQPISPAPLIAAPSQSVNAPKPNRQPTNWVAWFALLVSIGSGIGTTCNSITSNRNYNRLSGKVRAKVELVGALPKQEDVPPHLIEVSDIFETPELTLHEPDDFFRLRPLVVLKNVGDEPISEIRLETRLAMSFIDARGVAMDQVRPTPWAYEDATRDEYVLGEKLMPGKSVAVSITKGLLKQMIQLQANDQPDKWHYAQFDIQCMAKLVNGVAFDGAEEEGRYRVKFRWKPAGFPEDKCKAMLEKLKHVPIIEKDEPRLPAPAAEE